MNILKARAISGTQDPRTAARQAEEQSVVMAQPHREGVSARPADAWMATASGQFCRRHWPDSEAWGYWRGGERYARLIDDDRIAWGLPPRQCAMQQAGESSMTISEQRERRFEASGLVRACGASIREAEVNMALINLVWGDIMPPQSIWSGVADGFKRLSVHFESMAAKKKYRA